jgi:hypothetical protein
MMKKGMIVQAAVVLLLAAAVLAGCAGPGAMTQDSGTAISPGGIAGKLTHDGRPLQGAYVYAYRSQGTNLLGPADFASDASSRDGSYSIDLVAGAYYIVARRRVSGENTGPIATGDLYSVHPANPVTVREGKTTAADLDLKLMRDPMFFQAQSRTESKQGVRGVILDEKGDPASWVFAMAYTSRDMKRIPEYTSVMTDGSGTFEIFLPQGGKYWLAARKNVREKPVSGEPYGLYRGSSDYSIVVPDGKFIEGVEIRLEPYRKGIQD